MEQPESMPVPGKYPEPGGPPTPVDQIVAYFKRIWKWLAILAGILLTVLGFSIWLVFFGPFTHKTAPKSPPTTDVSAARIGDSTTPAPVVIPGATAKPNPTGSDTKAGADSVTLTPWEQQLRARCTGPCTGPPPGLTDANAIPGGQGYNPNQTSASTTSAERTPEQETQQRERDFEWAARHAAPDDSPEQIAGTQRESPQPPTASAPEDKESQPNQQGAFPPVATREEEIAGQKNASYCKSGGHEYRLFGGVDVIEARLMNQINGDFPGSFRAIVTQDTYDLHHEAVLIPKGSILVGSYGATGAGDQERVPGRVSSLLKPNGCRVTFTETPITDAAGAAGLKDKVNRHTFQRFAVAIGISAIGATAQYGNYQNAFSYDPASQFRNNFTANMGNQAMETIREKQPRRNTLIIGAGKHVQLPLGNDVLLSDWTKDIVDPHI